VLILLVRLLSRGHGRTAPILLPWLKEEVSHFLPISVKQCILMFIAFFKECIKVSILVLMKCVVVTKGHNFSAFFWVL
jgi:hypothetical protein